MFIVKIKKRMSHTNDEESERLQAAVDSKGRVQVSCERPLAVRKEKGHVQVDK